MSQVSISKEKPFTFKQFTLHQDKCTMKLNTDGVLLGAWVDVSNANSLLDIGTGTGVIAIMMAQRNQEAKILGVEIDDASAIQAQENMAASPWQDRLHIERGSIQDFAKLSRQTFDGIVSNPPFFTGGVFSHNENKNNVRHTVKLPHGDLLQSVKKLLSPKGKFSLILPYLEGLRFKEMAANYGLFCTRETEVITKKGKPVERVLLQFQQQKGSLESDTITINDEDGFSEKYKAMTKDFYLTF